MMTMTPSPRTLWTAIALATLSALGALALQASAAADGKPASAASAPAAKSALTVTVTQARSADLALRIAANGNIAAWQEASVGTETNGLRLDQVLVNVGDTVRRGQVLATFAPDTLQAEAAQLTATLAEAEASLAEARTNAQRARDLQASGALSAQQINQYLTAERTAQARLEAQQAMAKVQQLRLAAP
jgi:multidrug efflux pump subunit AcrA (membrane-fusion protein)